MTATGGQSSPKIEIHHGIARSRGGSDDDWNLYPLTEYEHAFEHALDYVLFPHAPQFCYQMKGWQLLPKDLQDAVRKEHSRRMSSHNPSRDPKVKQKKKETFEKNGTHNFCTPEGRERNRQRAIKRNKENNSRHNKSPVMRAATLKNNAVRCCCLECGKECSRPGMGMHLRAHDKMNHDCSPK
jgi:hypothetical protein